MNLSRNPNAIHAGMRVVGAMPILASAYVLSGKPGLLLAIPPGYWIAIFPPVGIALTALLICGYRP